MTDVTQNNLELALLDQKVAGQFHGKEYAFVGLTDGQLGVAVKDVAGYNPIAGISFKSYAEAEGIACGMNDHIGLSRDAALDIVTSTMGRHNGHR